MNSAVLVAALLTPLVGAVVALLIPSGRRSAAAGLRGRRGRRLRKGKDEPGESSVEGAPSGSPATESPPTGVAAPAGTTVVAPEQAGSELPDPQAVERAGVASRTVVRVAALAAAALWIAITLLGPSAAGSARATGGVAPAAAGAALLFATVSRPGRRLPAAAGALALFLATGGLALGVGEGRAGYAVAGLAGACVLVTLAGRSGGKELIGLCALALAGTAAIAGGFARVVGATGSLSLPSDGRLDLDAGLLLVAGAGAVAVAAALRPRRSTALLLPVALAIGVPAAGVFGAAGDGLALALMLLALAVTVGWAATTAQFPDARLLAAALALVALAAAAVPSSGVPGSGAAVNGIQSAGVPAAWLLAVAAVVTAVCLVPLAALSAVPGAAALVVVLIADPEPARLVLAVLTVALAVAATAASAAIRGAGSLAVDPGTAEPRLAGSLTAVPALALGAWLVVAPTSWTWAGAVNLDGWSDSVALAVAGGLIAAVAAGAAGRVAVPRLPLLAAPDPTVPSAEGGSGRALALVAGAALGLALLALLLVG